jgi:hypothetical protein
MIGPLRVLAGAVSVTGVVRTVVRFLHRHLRVLFRIVRDAGAVD